MRVCVCVRLLACVCVSLLHEGLRYSLMFRSLEVS